MKNKLISLFLGAAVSVAAAATAQAGTLDDVRQKGFLQCGVSQGLIGFSNPDEQNNWTGMDVDFCRAVAAAVLGDPQKVKFTPLTAKERFTALQSRYPLAQHHLDDEPRYLAWPQVRGHHVL